MKTMKQLLCLFGILAALCTSGCATVHSMRIAGAGIDPRLLEDNLIEETEGGPVVAPTTTTNQPEPDKTGGTNHFGEERYIWENWDPEK